jgi:outer membrane receptor protein involved in Fe transport
VKYFFIWILIFPLLATAQLPKDSASSVVNLKEITISGNNKRDAVDLITQVDRQLRPTNSAQDLLRLVPGLFIAQHAGGGKAEQIFLRGFDCDHGTDFSVNIDGMPVNMVSHAHGQGYADFHFVIPETIDKLKVFKGTYAAQYGDFATAGAGEFTTKNNIGRSMVKTELGRFDTYRALAMIDILQGKHLLTKNNENFYAAGEYNFTNSYFENKQNLSRFNFFTKYSAQINARNFFMASVSSFSSSWNASGQIPDRAVSDGVVDRYGSIDPSEGGNTSRSNINLSLSTQLANGALLKNQAYYCRYKFNLYSNFTFFLIDTVNGDEINQRENGRNTYGYKTSYEKNSMLFGRTLKSVAALGTRIDEGDLYLAHTVKRAFLDTISAGHLYQQNAYAYIDETLWLSGKLSLNGSVRFDYFDFSFRSFLYDSLSGRKQVPKVSPKLNLTYDHSSRLQLYVRSGYGFHSNDARSVVVNTSRNSVPKAFGYEAGSIFKPLPGLIVNAALWGLDLQNELVYVGDAAVVEISGATRRLGADVSLRWQLFRNLYADADINYNYARYRNLPKGENYIPLAPSLTSTGGLSYRRDKGINAALRYRYMKSRPANEDNSVVALGYFLLDATVNYTTPKYQVGISVENLLNSKWNQAQFNTESRLKSESQAYTGLHFTPGTPFFIKGSFSIFF